MLLEKNKEKVIKFLDTRISDWYTEQGELVDVTNTQTFREFIRETENMLGINNADIDNMKYENLQEYLNWLDDIWGK